MSPVWKTAMHETPYFGGRTQTVERAAAGCGERGHQAVPNHHRGAQAQLLSNIVKGRIDAKLTSKAATVHRSSAAGVQEPVHQQRA